MPRACDRPRRAACRFARLPSFPDFIAPLDFSRNPFAFAYFGTSFTLYTRKRVLLRPLEGKKKKNETLLYR